MGMKSLIVGRPPLQHVRLAVSGSLKHRGTEAPDGTSVHTCLLGLWSEGLCLMLVQQPECLMCIKCIRTSDRLARLASIVIVVEAR